MGMELEALTPDFRESLGLSPQQAGVFVSDVVGIARDSGMQEGDVIVAVGGRATPDPVAFRQATIAAQGAAAVQIDLIRDGQLRSVALGAGAVVQAPAPIAPAAAPVGWLGFGPGPGYGRGAGYGPRYGYGPCYGPGCPAAPPGAAPGLGYGPGQGRCWPVQPNGATPVGLPPGCATCPSSPGCFASSGPGVQAALPCYTGACPAP
jgi:hypothetical protein